MKYRVADRAGHELREPSNSRGAEEQKIRNNQQRHTHKVTEEDYLRLA